MDNKKKVQGPNVVMNGITINGPMFDIHDNHNVIVPPPYPSHSRKGEWFRAIVVYTFRLSSLSK